MRICQSVSVATGRCALSSTICRPCKTCTVWRDQQYTPALARSLEIMFGLMNSFSFEVVVLLLGYASKYTLISRAGRDLPQTHYDSGLNVHLPLLTHCDNSCSLSDVTSPSLLRNERTGADSICFCLREILACFSPAKECTCFTAISCCFFASCNVPTAIPAANRETVIQSS